MTTNHRIRFSVSRVLIIGASGLDIIKEIAERAT